MFAVRSAFYVYPRTVKKKRILSSTSEFYQFLPQMAFLPVILIAALACVIYLRLHHHYRYWARRNVPGEAPKFFIGNMRGIGTRYHWKHINSRIYKKFKGRTRFVGMFTFLHKSLMILDPELIKQIMVKDFNYFADRGIFHNAKDDPLTGNLLFLDGEAWRVLRHKLSPVFTSGKMRYMFPTMVEVGAQLADACGNLLRQQGGANSTKGVLELKELCARYTTDVIGSVAFGIECNSLSNPDAQFRNMGRLIFAQPRHSLSVQAFMIADPELARRLRMKTFRDDTAEFFTQAVHETVTYREQNGVKRNDFMDLLLELKAQRDRLLAEGKSELCADDLTNGLTLEQVAAQAFVFFLAGFETTSTLMAFCLYELALNPHVQERLREEIVGVLAQHDGILTYEAIKEMKYLELVICETLRMHSVLPHLVRKTTAEYRIPNSDLVLPKGISIVIPVDAMHNDPELYPQPEVFDPSRFDPNARHGPTHPFVYLPFGEGPRNCIGMRFGKLQAEIGIISLLRNFRFSRAENTQIPIQYDKKNFLIMPESGIELQVDMFQEDGE